MWGGLADGLTRPRSFVGVEMGRLLRLAYWLPTALLGLAMLGLYSASAFAGDATLTWTAPTARTDGTPLTNLAGFKIYHGTSSTTLSVVVDVPGATVTSRVLTGLPSGMRYFAMTAYDANLRESAQTSTVSKTILDAPPNPPGNFVVTATLAYTVVKQVDRFVMLPVGTVPADTACSAANSISNATGTYYVVPRHVVTWSGSVRADVVVAKCG